MNIKNIHAVLICLAVLLILSCERDQVLPESQYYNTLSFADSSATHPKAVIYQGILDDYANGGGIGISVMIRDEYGTYLGTSGYADIVSGVQVEPGNQFLVASVSKMITATAAFALMEGGLFSMDDPVNRWIDRSITDEIGNANESTVRNLLGHTSGIRDIYTFKHLMPYMNRENNHWDDRDMLKFIYGKEPYYSVDEAWYYSNVNYILLGMIMEEASGLSLKEIYEQHIFNPLGLQSAFYDVGDQRLPEGLVKGYTDIHTNNWHVESERFYQDDVGIGGDGGIAINAQDLGRFMDELMAGNVISQTSLDQMMDWFEGGYSTGGLAGYGIYSYPGFEDRPGIGHSGGIIGWEADVTYYPEQDVTLVFMINNDLILSTTETDDNFNHFSLTLKEAIFE